MGDTEKKLEALEQESSGLRASANPQADVPKKNVAYSSSHLKNDAEDLGQKRS